MMLKWNLIYVDDQVENINCFKDLLHEQFNVIGCTDPIFFPHILEMVFPHVILLDVHMPGKDGYAIYKDILEHPLYNNCPVIFISGDLSDEVKLRSFREGGVDFFPRDTNADEIVLRLANKINLFLKMATRLELGNLLINLVEMRASINDKNLDLTLVEMRLLTTIMRAYPLKITRQELVNRVWGNTAIKPGTVNTHLTNLKPKIEGWNFQIKIRDDVILIQPNKL